MEAESWYRQGFTLACETQDAANQASIASALGALLILHRDQRDAGCQLLGEAARTYDTMGLAEQAERIQALAHKLGCGE